LFSLPEGINSEKGCAPLHAPEICIVDCGSGTTAGIGNLCTGAGCTYRIVPLAEADIVTLSFHDGIVISGGSHYFAGPASAALSDAFAFIDAITKPMLGICLGHQAIGVRYGAKAFRGMRRQGKETIRLRCRHPLVAGLQTGFAVQEDHCEGISLPEHFMLVGDSESYAVEIMANNTQPLFGVQFHPEISGVIGEILFMNFINIVHAWRRKKS